MEDEIKRIKRAWNKMQDKWKRRLPTQAELEQMTLWAKRIFGEGYSGDVGGKFYDVE